MNSIIKNDGGPMVVQSHYAKAHMGVRDIEPYRKDALRRAEQGITGDIITDYVPYSSILARTMLTADINKDDTIVGFIGRGDNGNHTLYEVLPLLKFTKARSVEIYTFADNFDRFAWIEDIIASREHYGRKSRMYRQWSVTTMPRALLWLNGEKVLLVKGKDRFYREGVDGVVHANFRQLSVKQE